jgi:hypothetical protein
MKQARNTYFFEALVLPSRVVFGFVDHGLMRTTFELSAISDAGMAYLVAFGPTMARIFCWVISFWAA